MSRCSKCMSGGSLASSAVMKGVTPSAYSRIDAVVPRGGSMKAASFFPEYRIVDDNKELRGGIGRSKTSMNGGVAESSAINLIKTLTPLSKPPLSGGKGKPAKKVAKKKAAKKKVTKKH
jgi:hypothetical protein